MLLFTLLLGCSPSDDPVPGIERDVLWAMPNDSLIDADGHLDLPADRLPHPIAGTAIPVERLAWRTGFSPVQTTVFFPTERLDPDSLPTPAESEEAGSVQIWDLDSGERIPGFAEIDLFPQDEELPTLLVRPLVPMSVGHRIAVVVTEDVTTESGESISIPEWVTVALEGEEVEGMLAATYREDAAALAELGVEDIAFFSAFPVADGSDQLRSMVDAVTVPQGWTFDEPQTSEETDLIPPGIWTRVEGSFEINDFLVDDMQFELDSQGMPIEQGTGDVELFVYISDGAAAADPGTAPVWIFGHGVFSEPDFYLFKEEDVSGVADIADRAGAILLGTVWRGMTYTDVLTAINVGNDFGRIPELSDKLAQGVANNVALSRLILEGDLLDDPVFGGVADPSQVFYYGISLGGIQGAVLMANNPYIDHAVLHVGGSTWSTLLERSSHWPTFEILVEAGIPSPAERQVLYSLSQLFWDISDPACFASELSDRSVLWQEAIGDEQVPNLTTEILARGVGAPLMSPSATTPPLLDFVEAPTIGPVLVQYDSELGIPPEGNRPAVVTGAHDAPRLWEGQHAQVLRFLDPVDPGVVEHYCGDAVCSASNTGD